MVLHIDCFWTLGLDDKLEDAVRMRGTLTYESSEHN